MGIGPTATATATVTTATVTATTAASDVNGVQVATAVVAGLAFLLAVVSLGWQIASWRMSGPRVSVRLLVGGLRGTTHASVTVRADKDWRANLTEFRNEGMTPLVGVEVVNSGRAATSVTGVQGALDSGQRFGTLDNPLGKPLPHRLDSHDSGVWFLPLSDATEIIDAVRRQPDKYPIPTRLTMRIDLGGGNTIETERFLSVDQLMSWSVDAGGHR